MSADFNVGGPFKTEHGSIVPAGIMKFVKWTHEIEPQLSPHKSLNVLSLKDWLANKELNFALRDQVHNMNRVSAHINLCAYFTFPCSFCSLSPSRRLTFSCGQGLRKRRGKPIYQVSNIIYPHVYLWRSTPRSSVDSTWYSINLSNENLSSVINK